MKNLLQKPGLKKEKKPLFKMTTLSNSDLVALNREFDHAHLIKKYYFSYAQNKFPEINSLNPQISSKCMGNFTDIEII